MKKLLSVAAFASCLALAFGIGLTARAARPSAAGKVSFLAGEATREADGTKEKLAIGSAVYEKDVIETSSKSRLEITLSDQSALRLGPKSSLRLETAVFGKSVEDRQVNAKLMVGNVWAEVAHAVGGGAKFEVQTENAVAGVRGTTFRVDAKHDRSCVVKVYAGAVAVAGGVVKPGHLNGATPDEPPKASDGGPGRHQIAGPQEVSREQWEKSVGAMMQVRIGANGKASEVEAFNLASPGEDEWEQWNRQRSRAK